MKRPNAASSSPQHPKPHLAKPHLARIAPLWVGAALNQDLHQRLDREPGLDRGSAPDLATALANLLSAIVVAQGSTPDRVMESLAIHSKDMT